MAKIEIVSNHEELIGELAVEPDTSRGDVNVWVGNTLRAAFVKDVEPAPEDEEDESDELGELDDNESTGEQSQEQPDEEQAKRDAANAKRRAATQAKREAAQT